MSIDDVITDDRKNPRFKFERHATHYRDQFETVTEKMQSECPVAWSDTYDGHWVAAGNKEVFELARCPYVSNDHDVTGDGTGYKGISIPTPNRGNGSRGGILEMDEPEHKAYRSFLNPYLSPAAVKRWIPLIDEVVHACIDEKIESGQIDFVDDLANVVPAVLTLGMLGIPLEKWTIYNEAVHAAVYTPIDSPEIAHVNELHKAMGLDLYTSLMEIRENPRPGVINELLEARIDGEPLPDMEIFGNLGLLIGGGFDTTTALTAHSLEWLAYNTEARQDLSDNRDEMLDAATEEFLRYYTPAPGDGRTINEDVEIDGIEFREGDRLWLSWAMANRDPEVFDDPNEIMLDRTGNRHYSFGLGVHRCIGSNVARTVYKRMLLAVLDRMPDYKVDPETTVHYESIGVIQGMRHLPATFTPGPRTHAGLDETLVKLQQMVDDERLAEPLVIAKRNAAGQ